MKTDNELISLKEFITESKYHSSWDWLMPVVEKIASMKFPIYIYNSHIQNTVEIFKANSSMNIIRFTSTKETTLQLTYQAIVEFIKWYNQPKP